MDNCRHDEGECSYCGKEREGVTCVMDGAEVFLCKADFWKMLKLRSARPKAEPSTPLFNGMEPAERFDVA